MEKKSNNGAGSVDLIQIIHTLWKNILAIILAALIAAAGAFAFTYFFVTPQYEAVASLYVNNSSFSFGATSFSISSSEISASNSLVNSFVFLLKSRETLEAVIADTGVNYNYKELKEKIIKTEAVPDTPALYVTVSSANPEEAELIANSIAKILPERISEIIDGASARIVDHAIIPAYRSTPNYTKVLVLFGLIGALTASIGFILSNIFNNLQNETIGNSTNVLMQYTQLQILGTVPDMDLSEKKGYYYSSYYENKKREKK